MTTPIINRTAPAGEILWHQIEVSGQHRNRDIVQVIDQDALAAIVANFQALKAETGDHWSGLLIDPDHLSHDPEHSTEAYGWLWDVRVNSEGQLEGQIELTDLGATAVAGKRYKFFSTEYPGNLALWEPVPAVAKNAYRPTTLLGLALTNRPNNKGGKPLINAAAPGDATSPNTQPNSPQPTMYPTIAKALGLPEDADEAKILETIAALQSAKDESEVEVMLNRSEWTAKLKDQPELRAQVKSLLLTNRAQGENLLKVLPTPVAPAAVTPAFAQTPTPSVLNRAKSPDRAVADDEAATVKDQQRASQIRNRAAEISSTQRISFERAWPLAEAEFAK